MKPNLKEGQKHYSNKKLASFQDVLNKEDLENLLDIWYEKTDNRNNYVHPTQKPVRLAERALRKSSQPGDIVLDAFGGSGSTLIACEQLNRKAYLMELDPKYVDVIIKRWELFTSEKAKKI